MARQAKGSLSQTLIAFESTTYGTLPGSPTVYKIPFSTNALEGSQDLIEPDEIHGDRDDLEAGLGIIDAKGKITGPIDVRNFGLILNMLLSAPTTTNVSTHGTLTGATSVDDTIGTWTAITDGKFKISIDGSAATEVGPIDFSSGVTDIDDVADKIEAAIQAIGTGGFTAATVVWSSTNGQFVITSGTTGNSSAVSNLTAPAAGTNISGSSYMKCTAGTAVAGKTLYSHVWMTADELRSATIEKGFTDISSYVRYPGSKADKLTINAEMGNNLLKYDLDLISANELTYSTPLEDEPTELTFTRFNMFQGSMSEGGTELTNCRKMSLELSNNLDGDTTCFNSSGSTVKQDINEGKVSVSGDIETLFKDSTLLEKAKNATTTSLGMTFVNGDFSLTFAMAQAKLAKNSPTIDGPKGIKFSPKYRAYKDSSNANGTILKVTLINDVASYALPA